ncbi:response regulator transcription factor [Myxococcus sp. CA051A]|uniref:Response regulator transcription factor n=1 Tax=Myxococcus llanfairpwllgwyngyllgogerychwyrndrobwllllantysiliogogogochensis TaxID=2590453 RepID=A0A540WVD5_9BACT|nr:LytTR family DNA-binding domain-containing protein [Myxococcus llanfairpwllgwyngyllgogerychwyrndrobwllllantysiliogogogochensis]NTX01377.1 response regulator transcription factor [Myxococcus sp. CA040A]NTX15597.1 response regulator transcription factor [Myxococcus sp. CA056]NTX32932.1 response regulator transcription factor [Myxococcus sp. CA033]NTX49972.1 response regulator transcription factor [Myxococcus sp. CA039A]NTX60003.1 response regulator transcription factor [Myxococcus sp. CA051A]
MRLLIVEDEPLAARRLARLCEQQLGPDAPPPRVCASLDEARELLAERTVDVLLLDLNLSGEDGFALLEEVAAGAFQTVVVSANTDQALRAFELGVLDFVPKPYTPERLALALARVGSRAATPLRALAVRKGGGVVLVPLDSVAYIQGAGDYTELVLRGGGTELSEKSLERLEQLLPADFFRIHRSYLIRVTDIRELISTEGSRTSVELRDGTRLPVGRSRVGVLRKRLEA